MRIEIIPFSIKLDLMKLCLEKDYLNRRAARSQMRRELHSRRCCDWYSEDSKYIRRGSGQLVG